MPPIPPKHNTKLSRALIDKISQLSSRNEFDPRPVVLMTCGVAAQRTHPGAGKSTLSHLITSTFPNFARLSIDAWVYTNYGLCGVDYPEDKHEAYTNAANSALKNELSALLKEHQRNVILDFAFPFRDMRDEWRDVVQGNSGRWVMFYLGLEEGELRRRVKERNERDVKDKDADSSFVLEDERLSAYLEGFEVPVGEGEIGLCWGDRDTITLV